MVPQEIQTISCLLRGRTGGMDFEFPARRPQKADFRLKDNTPLRLLGFSVCHPSIVAEPGRKKVACFAEGREKKTLSRASWRELTESVNAVLLTRNGQHLGVEILKQNGSMVIKDRAKVEATYCFKKTGLADQFIPCHG